MADTATRRNRRPCVVLAMDERTRAALLPPALARRLAAVADVDPDTAVDDFAADRHADLLAAADILLTGWGVPTVNAAALTRMPQLHAIVHAAGSVKGFVTPAVFDREISVSSAAAANAIPVAEFTLAAVIFAAKRVGRFVHESRRARGRGPWDLPVGDVGCFGRTVGVIGASHIGRQVIARLHRLDVTILLTDPTVDSSAAQALGAELVDLPELLRRSGIVTVHAPAIPATHHLLDAEHLAMLRDGATVINTARGSLIDTAALTAELVAGRIDAVLDVTDPEPLPADSPLYDLPNVQLTPHIAGSLGSEVTRLGETAVAEIERLAAGQPLVHVVRGADLHSLA